jgi:hypothetical protein
MRTISVTLPPDQKELRRRPRQTIRDPKNQDQFIEMFGQIREHVLEFKIYALNPEEADDLLIKFEDFLISYTPYLVQNGAKNIYFYRQLEDGLITEWHNPVLTRTFQYQLRLEKVTFNRLGELTDIHINIQHPLS